MSAENIYEIMEVSKQASKIVEDSGADVEEKNSNALLWILGGMLILGVIIYINYENKRKEI